MAKGMKLTPVSWVTGFDDTDTRIDLMKQEDGSTKYAVYRGSLCLSKKGAWDHEPMPSSRTKAYLNRHRFTSLHEAIAALSNTESA